MPKVLLKPGCRFDVLAPAGFAILDALRDIAKFFPQHSTITAGTNGQHAENSKHHTGEAFDIRSHDMDESKQAQFRESVTMALGMEKFTLLLEDQGRPNEHWHLQKRKGQTYTVKDLLA